MRFAQAHKTTSYAMVLAAYLGLVLGGGVSTIVAVLGFAGLVGSWWWEPPRIRWETWALPWTLASVVALAWTIVQAIATGDYLGVGGDFLVWLVVAKAFQRRAAKDWQQLYLLAFLMLVAGSVLNPDLSYGACFLLYVIASTWALILFHLRREMEDNFLLKHADDRASERVEVRRILESRRIVNRRFFVGTGLVSLGVFLASSALFLAIPRVGMGFFFRSRSGMAMAGFSDTVKLGGHGRIKSDTTIVMRVEIGERYQGRSAPYIHWRGVAFDTYSHGMWTRTRRAPVTHTMIDRPGPTQERRYLLYERPRATDAEVARDFAAGTRQRIWLEPLDSDVLFGASMPVGFVTDVPIGMRRPRNERNDEIRFDHRAAIAYEVWSDVEAPTAAALRAAGGELPPGFAVYLGLPDDQITARTRALAQRIVAGKATTYDKAVAIKDWLTTNLEYTLDLEDPGGREPVDFFLFERKKGHCEYFASAFVILARAAGIPARNVNGFLGGEWNEYDDYIAVRAGDAHSWAEVYFPGPGWVTFDATPASEVDRLGRGDGGLGARVRRMLDTLTFQWSKWVVDYDLFQQLSLFRDIGDSAQGGARWIKDVVSGVVAAVKRNVWFAGPLGGAAAAAIAAWWWRRRRRLGPTAAMERARPRKRSPMAAVYASATGRLARRGHGRDAAATPREHAGALAERGVPGGAELVELTELYYAAEWGGSASTEELDRARALERAIEAALAAAPARAGVA
jgi:transglutaminase-like putative cysteine protease